MMNLLKKKLSNRVLVCIGLPYEKEQFFDLAKSDCSDFVNSLKCEYQTNNYNELWKKYKKSAKEIKGTIDKCVSCGANVLIDFDYSVLPRFKQYDIIVLLVHHSEKNKEIEFLGKMFDEKSFAEHFPSDFDGILDLTSCYSENLQYLLKVKSSSELFHSIGVSNKTPLSFRLILLQRIIDELCYKKGIQYFEAYKNSIESLLHILPDGERLRNGIIYLGGRSKSTIYAPAETNRGESFITQIFIHQEENSESVELIAKTIDDQTTIRNSKFLPFKIKKNDKIEFELNWQKEAGNDFKADKKRKSLIWTNEPSSVEFVIQVMPNCNTQAFLGRLKIAINKQPVGDIVFKTRIISEHTPFRNCTNEMDFNSIDKKVVQLSESTKLNAKLDLEQKKLSIAMEKAQNEQEKDKIANEIAMCNQLKCIINSNPTAIDNGVIKVFVSSTSDMAKYRDIIKKQISDLRMLPISYDNWSQEDIYPRDICCQQVMASNIFVCLLGSNYGFVEPKWCMSMTEIEYRVAVKSGIPILIYILKDYEKGMEDMLPENKESVEKQKALIEELKIKRLVELFNSEWSLQLKFCEELTRLKTQMEFGINK